MRIRLTSGTFSVNAIAGTYVVMFGFNLPAADCPGLLGFSIHRQDHTENEAYFLEAQKAFEKTDPGFPAGSLYSTRDHPIQSFQWADYSAKPGHDYTYTIAALNGSPQQLESFATVAIQVQTERAEGAEHQVYFNRGVAGSQAYIRRFGNKPPDKVANNRAFEWLSRGLYEAMCAFVSQDAGPGTSLRISAYEFHYPPFLKVIKAAAKAGSDIEIIFDGRQAKPGDLNRDAVKAAGITKLTRQRLANKSYLSHNKFIVRMKNNVPESVWTGGTNFSDGGIFGHSNVAHVVSGTLLAQAYLDYWSLLAGDPENDSLEPALQALSPLPAAQAPVGTTPIFSPRPNLDVLQWYADVAKSAQQGLFMTFAFGINQVFQDVYKTGTAPLRFALLEQKTRSMKEGPAKKAEEKKIDDLRKKVENVFAIGGLVKDNKLEGWVKERLTGLNTHVKYVHNKFMLVDPLSEDPMVIAGSANFSDASTIQNDENMLVIRGNKRVADIYLGEFMRLYNHHAFRESRQWQKPGDQPKWLKEDDWWRDYFNGSSRDARRQFFS